jgi:hypothetical protein
MNRAQALVGIRVAGYHEDQRTFMRLYTENRISYAKATEEFRRGQAMKKGGVPCGCPSCKRAS